MINIQIYYQFVKVKKIYLKINNIQYNNYNKLQKILILKMKS